MNLYMVVPCYNEEELLLDTGHKLWKKIEELVGKGLIDEDSRVLFIDDGSSDDSWSLIKDLGDQSNVFQGIRFSRNEGHQNALLGGYHYAYHLGADAVISIDADLQQDINAVDEFMQANINGYDIVYGIRRSRSTDGILKKITAHCFYCIMDVLGAGIIRNHADYRLLSRRALKALLEYDEKMLFLRGMVRILGFKETKVYFDVKGREKGKSKYSISKMFSLALNGITSFSIKPIRIIFYIGILIMFVSIAMVAYDIVIWMRGIAVAGWASILCSLWMLGGLNFIFLGVIGEYIGKVYMESKHRPLFHVRERMNIDECD